MICNVSLPASGSKMKLGDSFKVVDGDGNVVEI